LKLLEQDPKTEAIVMIGEIGGSAEEEAAEYIKKHAFISLGAVKQATLQMVAPGIAEALIATAIGLFAAIPAVLAYNRLSLRVSRLEQSYLNFIDEFSAILQRQAVAVRK